jgi:molecular chaperone HscC
MALVRLQGMKMIIGIDLGTTNSLVSVYQDGKASLVKNALGSVITPSVVGVDDEGRIIVGQPAKDRLQTHPELTVAVFKRLMGTDQTIRLGTLELKPQELSSFILRQLKEDVEAELGITVAEAIVTVPAYFNDLQRKMTKLAGRLAEIKVERLLNEPTAAALAYGAHEELETQILVFDLGGGTFDVSILEMFDGIMEVRSSAGDNRLGGEDFSQIIVKDFLTYLVKEHHLAEDTLRSDFLPKILAECERAKTALSTQLEYTLSIELDGQSLEMTYSRDTFEKNAQPLLDRLILPVKQALTDSAIKLTELDQVLLVGGATRMPMISKMVARMFGRLPSREVNPDEVVAQGAGYQAALKAQDQQVNDVVLTDVCPFTLGIEIVNDVGSRIINGVFSPIIERNTTVPVSRMERYFTTVDEQEHVAIKVYQGESRHTRNNVYLGLLDVPVPKDKAGEQALDVRFSYDINGLLEVETTVVSNNEKQSIIISNNQELTEDDIQKSLAKLTTMKVHPRENTGNIAFLYRANRLYEQHLGEAREEVGRIIDYFNSILERPNQEDVDAVRISLETELDKYEM